MATPITTASRAIITYSTGQTSDDIAQGAELAALMPGFEIKIPPVLIDPNYIPKNRGSILLGIFITSSLIALITVVLRIYSRLTIKERRLLVEDYFVIVAMVLMITTTTMSCCGVKELQWGYHTWDLRIRSMEITTIIVYIYQILGGWTLSSVRISLVLLIRRLYSQTGSRLICVCNAIIMFLVLGTIGSTFAMIFQCRPIPAGYDMWLRSRSSCDAVVTYYANCILSTISDAVVLALPLKLAWTLSTNWKKKIQVFSIMGLGCLAWIACIARFWFLDAAVRRYDWWSIVNGIICSHLEVTITIFCSSGPVLKALYSKISNSRQSRPRRSSWVRRTVWPSRSRNILFKDIIDSESTTVTTVSQSLDKDTAIVIPNDVSEAIEENQRKSSIVEIEKGTVGRPIAAHISQLHSPHRRISFVDNLPTPRTPRFREDLVTLGGDHGNKSDHTQFEESGDSLRQPATGNSQPPTPETEPIDRVDVPPTIDEESDFQVSSYTFETTYTLAPLSPRPQELSQRQEEIYIPCRMNRRLTMVPEESDEEGTGDEFDEESYQESE